MGSRQGRDEERGRPEDRGYVLPGCPHAKDVARHAAMATAASHLTRSVPRSRAPQERARGSLCFKPPLAPRTPSNGRRRSSSRKFTDIDDDSALPPPPRPRVDRTEPPYRPGASATYDVSKGQPNHPPFLARHSPLAIIVMFHTVGGSTNGCVLPTSSDRERWSRREGENGQ